MEEIESYRIGEVAELCGIAASTLRYYDKINLIKPSGLMKDNHYRYYTFKDIAKIRIIQNLKELHFTLDEMIRIMQENDLAYQLMLMKKKQQETLSKIHELERSYQSIHQRIETIEREMNALIPNASDDCTIKLKELPSRHILSIRRQSQQAGLSLYTLYFNELIALAREHDVISSGSFMLFHHHIDVNQPFHPRDENSPPKDIEVGMILAQSEPISFGREIPGGLHLTMSIKGMSGKETFEKNYVSIQRWLKENDYQAIGPMTDYILTDSSKLHPDHIVENILTEIQLPIAKR